MPRWKKGTTEFPVVVNHIRARNACTCTLPRPLLAHMGDPDVVVFVIDGNTVKVEVGENV